MSNQTRTRKFLLIGSTIAAGLVLGIAIGEACALMPPRLALGSYVRTHSVRKLQIGSGGYHLEGWLNTDIEPVSGEGYLDATRHFPLPDQSFEYIFSEHVFEHLNYDDGASMLRECYRILRPGGKIRIATPNLLKLIRLFQENKTDEERNYMRQKADIQQWPHSTTPECFILNLEMHNFGHQFVYDPATLRETITRAGFQNVAEFNPGESDDPQLKDLELRHKVAVRPVNDYETMVFQAVRP